jgi:TRAP-type C4-dicarboxylate transport system substrate-binding protein
MSIVLMHTFAVPVPASSEMKSIKLKMALHVPPGHYYTRTIAQWVKKIEDETNGKVQIKVFPGQTLGKMPDEWNMLRTGVSDLGWILPMYYHGAFPRVDVSDLPFVIPSGRPLNVVNGIFDKFLKDDFGEVKLLWPGLLGPVQLHMVKKKVATLEGMRGMQVRTPPGPLSDSIKALGATPVVIPLPEVYTAMERGMVDGTTMPFEALVAFKLHEVVDYHIVLDLSCGMNVTAMNLKVWNSLPPDVQKVFEDVSPWAQDLLNTAANEADTAAIAVCEKAGNKIITLPPEEKMRWVKAAKPVVDAWAAKMDSNGLPGTKIIDEISRLAEKKQ